MVTAAVWADLGGDGRPDLVLATEWGPIKVFHNTGAGFEDYTARLGLSGVTGWWSALAVADVNGDGRLDLIAGNVGLNTKYTASPEAPAVIFAGDLDGSARSAIIEAGYDSDGRLYPLRGRSTLASSFPWLRQKFPTFADFSRAPLENIFPPERLRAATRLTATELASGIFLQQADGTFKFSPLPRAAQLAPINGFVVADLDGDGLTDLYCVVGSGATSTFEEHYGSNWLRLGVFNSISETETDCVGAVSHLTPKASHARIISRWARFQFDDISAVNGAKPSRRRLPDSRNCGQGHRHKNHAQSGAQGISHPRHSFAIITWIESEGTSQRFRGLFSPAAGTYARNEGGFRACDTS